MRHFDKGRVLVLAAGTGNPFFTTDTCAALRGTELVPNVARLCGMNLYLRGTGPDGDHHGRRGGEGGVQAQQAKAHGCSRTYWLTHESNSKAMLLYERIAERSGFIQYRKLFKCELILI